MPTALRGHVMDGIQTLKTHPYPLPNRLLDARVATPNPMPTPSRGHGTQLLNLAGRLEDIAIVVAESFLDPIPPPPRGTFDKADPSGESRWHGVGPVQTSES